MKSRHYPVNAPADSVRAVRDASVGALDKISMRPGSQRDYLKFESQRWFGHRLESWSSAGVVLETGRKSALDQRTRADCSF